MIVAAGLTPAWQQIMRFDGFRTGEVNRALDVHWCASGKVLNVAIALAHLGAPVETIALVGGEPGARIEREFAAHKIRSRWIEAHHPTRVCTTILDTHSGRATELVENAGPVTRPELERFEAVYAESVAQAKLAILTGSLPAGAPPTFFRELLAITPCPTILDIRGAELTAALDRPVLLVKPNREELARTVGRDLTATAQLHTAMRELNDRGAEWVVITEGSEPAWVSSGGHFFRLRPPRVASVNPIGAGDCLAAGTAWGILAGKKMPEALRIGIAAAAENVVQVLPARLDPTSVLERAAMVEFESVGER